MERDTLIELDAFIRKTNKRLDFLEAKTDKIFAIDNSKLMRLRK